MKFVIVVVVVIVGIVAVIRFFGGLVESFLCTARLQPRCCVTTTASTNGMSISHNDQATRRTRLLQFVVVVVRVVGVFLCTTVFSRGVVPQPRLPPTV